MSNFVDTQYLIGSPTTSLLLTATNSATTDSKIAGVSGMDNLQIVVIYTPAANTRAVTVTVELNFDDSGWGQLAKISDATPSNGVVLSTANIQEYEVEGATSGTTYIKAIPIPAGYGKNVLLRVRAREDGANSFGTVKVILSRYTQTYN